LWRVAAEWLDQAQDDATVIAIRDQERAGLEVDRVERIQISIGRSWPWRRRNSGKSSRHSPLLGVPKHFEFGLHIPFLVAHSKHPHRRQPAL